MTIEHLIDTFVLMGNERRTKDEVFAEIDKIDDVSVVKDFCKYLINESFEEENYGDSADSGDSDEELPY